MKQDMTMRHRIVLWAVVFCLVSSVGHAQSTADIASFGGNAAATFNDLASEVRLIMFCPIDPASMPTGFQVSLEKQHELIDSEINRTKLIEQSRGGYNYGTWSGKNITGYVSLGISCINPLGPKERSFSVLYMPPGEQRMPDPILSHLLSKSSQQKLDGIDELSLDFPNPRFGQSKCVSSRTVSIGISSGAMTSTAFHVRCTD